MTKPMTEERLQKIEMIVDVGRLIIISIETTHELAQNSIELIKEIRRSWDENQEIRSATFALLKRNNAMLTRIARCKEALEFYADKENYRTVIMTENAKRTKRKRPIMAQRSILRDNGHRAREALK